MRLNTTPLFLCECLKETFRRGWAVTNALLVLLTLVGGLMVWRWPALLGDVNFLL